PTRDFYSLYGILSSSRYTARTLNLDAITRAATAISPVKDHLKELIAKSWEEQAGQFAARLIASAYRSSHEAIAGALASEKLQDPAHPMHAWSAMSRSTDFNREKETLVKNVQSYLVTASECGRDSEEFTDFSGWFLDVAAFSKPQNADFVTGLSETQPVLALVAPGVLNSARTSRRLEGVARSPTFTIRKRYIHALATGREARLRLVLDNFTLIRGPIYDGLHLVINSDIPKWVTFDLAMWPGQRAYLELADTSSTFPTEDSHSGKHKAVVDRDGFAGLSRVVFTDQPTPPMEMPWPVENVVGAADSLSALAGCYQKALISAIKAWRGGAMTSADFSLLNWAVSSSLLSQESNLEIAGLLLQLSVLEDRIPGPVYVASMTEGTPLDEPVFIRGSPRRLGEMVPRHF